MSTVEGVETWSKSGSNLRRAGRTPRPFAGPPVEANPVGFDLMVQNDQFATLNTADWSPYNNNTYGGPSRIQRYMSYNTQAGAGSAGSTGGTSLKLLTKREAVGGNAFTAGMVDSKTAGRYYPRYCRMESRMKIPHGHGLWPAYWLTAKNGGANYCEPDIMEYFIGQIPGKLSSTLHRADNSGALVTSVNKANKFFEAPTYTPDWMKMAIEITPVTDATGNTAANPASWSNYVRFKTYLNDVKMWDYVDTQATFWTTNGGSEDSFWNVFLQGCQVDGLWIGHPDGPLAYSEQLASGAGQCTIGGTPPNSCTITTGGYSVIRAGATGASATFADPSTTFEIDYHKVWKYTG